MPFPIIEHCQGLRRDNRGNPPFPAASNRCNAKFRKWLSSENYQ